MEKLIETKLFKLLYDRNSSERELQDELKIFFVRKKMLFFKKRDLFSIERP